MAGEGTAPEGVREGCIGPGPHLRPSQDALVGAYRFALVDRCLYDIEMTIRRVVPDVSCSDVGLASEFYVNVLGFQVGMDMGSLRTLVSPSNPTAQITLQTGASPNLTIEVDDVEAVHEAALRNGAQIVYPLTDETWGVRRFFVRDPSGMVVNVMSHTSPELSVDKPLLATKSFSNADQDNRD